MPRSSETPAWRAALGLVFALMLLAGCGDPSASDPGKEASASTAETASPAESVGDSATPSSPTAAPARSAPSSASAGAFGKRTGELVNPDSATMVFLYYDLAAIAPPIDSWVEEDSRVKFIPAIDKAAKRAEVRAELQSGIASVGDVGRLRLTMGANLSDYDPSYEEFTIRALAPSSMVEFPALGQKVSVKFANGLSAQLWKVPAAEAQSMRDKIGLAGSVSVDVALAITGVQPAPGGGSILTEVLGYELREDRSGVTLGRVQVVSE